MNYKITLTSGNDRLTLSPRSVCRVLDGGLEGFDSPSGEVNISDSAFADGGNFVSGKILPREITLYFEVCDVSKYVDVRDIVMRMSVAGKKVDIMAYLYGRRRHIEAISSGETQLIRGNFNTLPKIKMKFRCPAPFFTEEKEYKITLPSAVPLFTAPITFMKNSGMTASLVNNKKKFKIVNVGDVACGFELKLTVTDGYVVNPAVTLNGKSIKLLSTLKVGDVVVFDTRLSSRGVRVNGAVRYDFARSSEFFSLERGENLLNIGADVGADRMLINVTYSPLYLGA